MLGTIYPESNRGWGATSEPFDAAAHLRLGEHLPHLPKGATIADLGAGCGLSMGIYFAIQRPDVSVISIDPRLGSNLEFAFLPRGLSYAIEKLEPCQRVLVQASRWLLDNIR